MGRQNSTSKLNLIGCSFVSHSLRNHLDWAVVWVVCWGRFGQAFMSLIGYIRARFVFKIIAYLIVHY